MSGVIISPDSSMEGLKMENARLRNLVTNGREGLLSPPPSPPLGPTKGTPIMSKGTPIISTTPFSCTPILNQPSEMPVPQVSLNPLAAATTITSALNSIPLDPANPLYAVIELMKSQMLAQAQAQENLISQLGELRSSHASLQANTSEVNDELTCLKDKSKILADQVEDERKKRLQVEQEKQEEAEKVTNLRQKMEESRRAIMRLQEEAAAKRNSDSRRSSIVTLATPNSSVLGSASAILGSRNTRHARRRSLMAGMEASGSETPPVPPIPPLNKARRASMAELGASTDARRDFIKDANRRASLAVDRRRSIQFNSNNDEVDVSSPASVGLGLEFEDTAQEAGPSLPNLASTRDLSVRRRSSCRVTGPPATRRGSTLSTVLMSEEDDAEEKHNVVPRSLSLCARSGDENMARSLHKKTVRLSQDFGDARSIQPRAGSFAGFRSTSAVQDTNIESAEIAILKAQLAAANAKLAESQEAKSASEACLKALKEFMAAPGNIGGISLPPLPTDATEDTEEGAQMTSESIARRPSLWNIPAFLKSEAEKLPAVPALPSGINNQGNKSDGESPVLSAFNGWSARRRASTVAAKDKAPSAPPSPKLNSTTQSTAFNTFGGFSFQSRTRNPALMDSPPSPGGGWSPGGTTRDTLPDNPSPNAFNSDINQKRSHALATPPFASVADGVLARPSSLRRPPLPTIDSSSSATSVSAANAL